MVSYSFTFNKDIDLPIYIQLYNYFKQEILEGRIPSNEKLPSIREMAQTLNLSKTTIESAYSQLLVEGYIYSKPQSGYFSHAINQISPVAIEESLLNDIGETPIQNNKYILDDSIFDFIKWKKCINNVLMYESDELLSEASVQGEVQLRKELSTYVYRSRGVKCHPDQIVISAGTQQIMGILCVLLNNIEHSSIAFEDPGFFPARHIFLERHFKVEPVMVSKDGVNVNELRNSQCSLVYVSPSHQFPLGGVMPINNRFDLLTWANDTNGYIIEDDYDSELRYEEQPIPALQGLDHHNRVVYLGSFSTTLFPGFKVSYMILPPKLLKEYRHFAHQYTQTASKTEQLALSHYISLGLYQKHIKKMRKLFYTKYSLLVNAIHKHFGKRIKILSDSSGTYLLLEFFTDLSMENIIYISKDLGIKMTSLKLYSINEIDPVANFSSYENQDNIALLHFAMIPENKIESIIKLLANQIL